MKITSAFLLGSVVALTSYGQGRILFQNNNSSLVQNAQTPMVVPQPVGQNVLLALYAGPTGSTAGQLTLVSTSNAIIDPVPGRFSGGETGDITGIPLGGTATFQVRAWDGNLASTWEDFSMNVLPSNPTALRGVSDLFNSDTYTGIDIPFSIAAGFSTVNGIVLVPEPSTYALGAMGLGALAFLRRRKA